jgi:endoglucanase
MMERRAAARFNRPAKARAQVFAALAAGLVLVLASLPAEATGVHAGQPACGVKDPGGVPAARLDALARGFNLTGWLDGAAVRRPDERVLAALRARGFTHVRLPVTAERVMAAFTGRDDVERRLAELDRALGTLLALGFAVSLDVHPGHELSRLHAAEPRRGLALIEALWRSLARRTVGYPEEGLFFELLNEPAVDQETWNAQAAQLIAALRQEAPGRTLIYGPANFQRIDALLDVRPFLDPNIVYAVHFYDPMIFTHQGLDWSEDPLRHLHGIPFPADLADRRVGELLGILASPDAARLVERELSSPWTEQRIESEIARAAAWADKHRRTVIINEFGVLGWKAPPQDRLRWLRTVRTAAERHCIGWTHWDYADGFGFVHRVGTHEIPDESLVDALLGRAPTE